MRAKLVSVLTVICLFISAAVQLPPHAYAASDKVLLEVRNYTGAGDPILEGVVRFEYNEDGSISCSHHDSYQNGSPSDGGYDNIFTYDDAGRLLSRNYYDIQWGTGFDDIVRSYDEEGRLVSDNMNGVGDVRTKKEYAYDESGQLIREHATYESPFLGGIVEHEYSYSYHTDDQGDLVGIRHDETDPGVEDKEYIYDAEGRITQGYDEDFMGNKISYTHTYIDDPYFLIEDAFKTVVYPTGGSETQNMRTAYILDSAGQEVESFSLGEPDIAKMIYDDDGYLIAVERSNEYGDSKTEFLYGDLAAAVADTTQRQEQSATPLTYEDKTEHYEFATSDGILTGTSDLTYPYFTDGSPMGEMLNESIEAVLDQRRNTPSDTEADPETESYYADLMAQGTPPGTNDVEITVAYNADGLVSLLYRYTFYNPGGAHSYTEFEGQIYDASTCEQLDAQDLAGSRYADMCAYLTQAASAEGISYGTPDGADCCVLREGGVDFYYNVGMAVPQVVVTVPFTPEYFDRASIDGPTADPEGTGSILTQEEAYTLAVAGSGVEDGETQTMNGSEYVFEFWDCGRAGYNGRSVYVYQVRRLQKIDGPQMSQLDETVLVDAITGECTVIPPFELLALDEDPLSDNGAGGEASASANDIPTQEAHPILTVTGNAVNIRSGPGTNYASIGKVNKGDKLFSTDKSDNWYQVEYGNGTGYIIEDYVTIEQGGFYTAVDSGTLAVNGIDVNIRSGPGTEYQSIGKVSRGTTLTITGKSDNWYQVSYNGGTGYIIEDYVIKNE